MTSSVNYLVTEYTILLISVVFLPVRAHTAIYLLSPCKQTTLKYELQYTHTDTNKRTHTVGIAHSSFSYFSYFTLSFFLREFKVLFPLFYFPHFHLYGMILSSSFFYVLLSFSATLKWKLSLAHVTSPLSLSALWALLWWGLLPFFSCVRCCSVVDSAEGRRGW